MIEAKNVQHNQFSADLGKDWIAVDDAGHILSRSNEETIKRSYPNASHFTGSDFKKSDMPNEPPSTDHPVFTAPAGVPSTPSGHPVTDALADDPTPEPGTRTHPLDDGTPYEGPDAIEKTDPRLNNIAAKSGTPIKDALKASHAAAKETTDAGGQPKVDDLQAAQVEVLEKAGVLKDDPKKPQDPDRPARKHTAEDTTKTANSPKAGRADGSKFDHDDDGHAGGSRKRKPA